MQGPRKIFWKSRVACWRLWNFIVSQNEFNRDLQPNNLLVKIFDTLWDNLGQNLQKLGIFNFKAIFWGQKNLRNLPKHYFYTRIQEDNFC